MAAGDEVHAARGMLVAGEYVDQRRAVWAGIRAGPLRRRAFCRALCEETGTDPLVHSLSRSLPVFVSRKRRARFGALQEAFSFLVIRF